MTYHYLCPLCQSPLAKNGKAYSCANNHQFDEAKEGYVHLLPVQFKKSKMPGDEKSMVDARRAFLAQGHYDFLQAALCGALTKVAPSMVLDVGCGEGYYTHAIADALPKSQVYGLDIAKEAVRQGAKRYANLAFSVASSKAAPFKGGQFEALVNVFAPIFTDESARLLASKGRLFTVTPAAQHLRELRELIYQDVRPFSAPKALSAFAEPKVTQLTETVTLDFDTLQTLVQMTPFAWKFKDVHFEALKAKSPMAITLDFYLSEYQKLK